MPRRVRRLAAVLLTIAAALGIALGSAGCATWKGARLYDRGSDALARGEVERAITELEQAATLVPHASEIRNHLGIAYAEAGRDGDALRAFQQAVELDCSNRAAWRNLRAAEAARERPDAP